MHFCFKLEYLDYFISCCVHHQQEKRRKKNKKTLKTKYEEWKSERNFYSY